MTQSNFYIIIDQLLKEEGGYVNHPQDPGGETKYGISKRSYPNLDIKNLTIDQAKSIYKSDYWDKIKGDFIPASIAFIIFDSAVNQGIKRASKFLQTALNVAADGVIGSKTIEAANKSNQKEIVLKIAELRKNHYISLNQPVFINGWLARLERIKAIALKRT